ncbi:MAG: hypothetical protein BAJATHORv1_70073 [Candidatus Thorarchaeota archaeon]|nr:MAG: hypothetical protein BAJATHORv1_70073 [Candidatus Thorarchaeota archaeon]
MTPKGNVTIEYRTTRGELKQAEFDSGTDTIKLSLKEMTKIDLSILSEFPNLEVLNLHFNHLPRIDLSPIADCEKLRALYLSQNRLRTIDLSPIAAAPSLEIVRLDSNRISSVDLYPLADNDTLKSLNLTDNPLETVDISPVYFTANVTISEKTPVIADYMFKYPRCPRNISDVVHRRMYFRPYNELFEEMGWKELHPRIETFLRNTPRNERFATQRSLYEGFKLGAIGCYDGPLSKIADALPEYGSYDSVRDELEAIMVLLLEEQLDNGGPTTFLDPEALKDTAAAHLVPKLEEVRKSEVENTVILIKKGKAYMRPLWATGLGFETLNKLNIGLETDMAGLQAVRGYLRSEGVQLQVEEVDYVRQKYYKASPSLRRHVFDMVLEYAKRRKR